MNKRNQFAGGVRSAAVLSVSLACLLAGTSAIAAGPVKAPPLPPGSSLVKVKPGMNPDEEKRSARAHKHKAGKVDPTGNKGNNGNNGSKS
jgi:hypothetical protein